MTESAIDKNQIVVGQPLPYSIYAADNTLLLAEGQIVKSEGVRELLTRNGARVAVCATVPLHERQTLSCAMTLPILERQFSLHLKATVLARETSTDANHPDVATYRLQFEDVSDADTLTLHAYLNGVLAMDMDTFWRLIALNEASNESVP